MKIHWFQIVSNAILILFLSILCVTTYVAFARKSGSTGQDMAKIQQQRYKDSYSQQVARQP